MRDVSDRADVMVKGDRAARVIAMAGRLAAPRTEPAFVMLSGVVGTGKSTLARALRERTGIAVIESDAVRRTMFARPAHAKEESAAVFEAVHAALRHLLGRGVATLVDATNLVEMQRAVMYGIARAAGARLIVVRTTAPAAVVRRRLRSRRESAGGAEAGTDVFERMRRSRQPIAVAHYVVDTTGDTEQAVEAIAREIERR
jgi:predicted kinase